MPSPTCQIMASMACADLGYRGTPIPETAFTDQHVAQVTTEAVARQRANFPLVCGSSPKQAERRNKRYGKAVEMDVRRILGIGFLAVIMVILGGPIGVILAIIGAVFQYLIEMELEDHWQAMLNAADMECA